MRLNVKAFMLTCGIMWGFSLFLLTWWIIAFEGATGDVTLIGRVYRGYTISPIGSFIGFIWAFIDGLIAGDYLRCSMGQMEKKRVIPLKEGNKEGNINEREHSCRNCLKL